MVIDYRKLNEKTISDRYPLPNITDILDKLGKCMYFTTLDLASGFHQIEVNPKDAPKTAFSVEFGHYEFVRMPFGLKNAPSTFQRVMDHVLGELQGKICLCYMDDIIVFSTSLQEHIISLNKVFTKLREANLKVQLDKSEFLHKEIAFLGHIVTSEGVKPNPDKIKAIQNFPIPRNEKQIKSFLGLLGYYRKFIKNFALITKPMTECLRKDSVINLNETYINCFEKCKKLLCEDPILQYPDFEQPFLVTTDASNVAIGAILSQGIIGQDLPICYASRTLTKTEQNYSTVEKELLAIVWATKYFRPYLFGRKFTIITDHKPLTWLFSLKEPNSKLVRWRLKLEEFDYNIIYKKGIQNANADALSRIQITPNHIEVNNTESSSSVEDTPSMLSTPDDLIPTTKNSTNMFERQLVIYLSSTLTEPLIKTEMFFKTRKRVTVHIPRKRGIKTIITEELRKLFGHSRNLTCIFASEECFQYISEAYKTMTSSKPRVINPKVNAVRSMSLLIDIEDEDKQKELIKTTHEQNEHRGIIENYEHIKKTYYFPRMKEIIREYVNQCDVCQQVKYDRQPPQLQLSLTETPKKPMEIIHTDIFQLEAVKFLTVIDKFSKFAAAYLLEEKTTKKISEALVQYFSQHGLPGKIIADSEIGNGGEVKALINKFQIELHVTTPYNSTGNSPVERLHSTLKEICSIIRLKDKDKKLGDVMNLAILSYNNSVHSTTKLTPFNLLKGHYVEKELDFANEIDYLQQHKERYEQLCNDIHKQSTEVKTRIITRINKKRKPSCPIPPKLFIYTKRKKRGKLRANYKKRQVLKDNGIVIETPEGKVHKTKIKRLFQVSKDHMPRNQADLT